MISASVAAVAVRKAERLAKRWRYCSADKSMLYHKMLIPFVQLLTRIPLEQSLRYC